MARRSGSRNRPVVPQAMAALDKLKFEIANEFNLPGDIINSGYWGNLPSAQCGAVGGEMVRRMIEAAQRSLIEETEAGVRAGFQSGLTHAGSSQAPTGTSQGTGQAGHSPPFQPL
ncbi:MAG: alpha/beta-type small acid-soluble spore protein [Firmicutes bacterium]|jgi:small acid-soluble spore protein A (major alpha-type SASP)|nr:alpha/beta-type small acid-soluble spore protein [Bacillota bacterium]